MRQDEENVKDLEAEGGHRQKLHRNHLSEVLAQEALPILGRGTLRSPDHVFGDGSLGHGEAQLGQLAVDTRRAPQWIGPGHLPDQGDGVLSNDFPARFHRAALPFPEAEMNLSMPADEGTGLEKLASN